MFRRYFIAGLLVILPIWVTLLILSFVVNLVDQSFQLLPKAYQPDVMLGVHIPGLGVVFGVILIFLTGMLVTNFIGTWFVAAWEAILTKIPLVRSIYPAVKQVLNTLFSPSGESFRKVVLIQYPHKDIWTIAFQTGAGFKVPGQAQDEFITVFVPTTPNPTAGFVLLVPKQQAIELNLGVDQALKYIISLGVVLPPSMAEHLMRTAKESI